MSEQIHMIPEEYPENRLSTPPQISLDIAYQAPKRAVYRVLLVSSGTTDPGYDSIAVIRSDHMGTYGMKDVGVHMYINAEGGIEWGRSLERAPEYPKSAQDTDLVILVHGQETSPARNAIHTLRQLLPVINAVHNNGLRFEGMVKHHARLGVGRDGKLIEPALQTPPEP